MDQAQRMTVIGIPAPGTDSLPPPTTSFPNTSSAKASLTRIAADGTRTLLRVLTANMQAAQQDFAAEPSYENPDLAGLIVPVDGDWDHKPKLRKMFGLESVVDDLYFPVPEPGGHREVYYDIYSNIHFGYIGAEAGIYPPMLIDGANLGTVVTGVNDPGDDIAMNAGIELSQQHGDDLTQAQLNDKITDVINQIDTAQSNGADTEQVRHR